jgi:hypothetical protein
VDNWSDGVGYPWGRHINQDIAARYLIRQVKPQNNNVPPHIVPLFGSSLASE